MLIFNDFGIEKCSNAEEYFLFDSSFSEEIKQNKWTLDSAGYVCRNKNGKLERLHRLVIETDGYKIPKGMYVDHVNKCKTDNRKCNLRLVTPQESARNMPIRNNNKFGVTGVCVGRGGKNYRAYITVNKKRADLGTYKTLNEAINARLRAEQKYHFQHQQNFVNFLIELEEQENENKL